MGQSSKGNKHKVYCQFRRRGSISVSFVCDRFFQGHKSLHGQTFRNFGAINRCSKSLSPKSEEKCKRPCRSLTIAVWSLNYHGTQSSLRVGLRRRWQRRLFSGWKLWLVFGLSDESSTAQQRLGAPAPAWEGTSLHRLPFTDCRWMKPAARRDVQTACGFEARLLCWGSAKYAGMLLIFKNACVMQNVEWI